MITGEFLVADDLAQAGRLAAAGEVLVLRTADQQLVVNEMIWVAGKMREADRLLVKLCKLVPWREGDELERIFDAMVNWTPEAVKYGLMQSYLTELKKELGERGKAEISVRSRFNWADYNIISDCVDFLRVARVHQLKKFLDYAFTGEATKDSGNRVYLAAAQMSMSMRKAAAEAHQ